MTAFVRKYKHAKKIRSYLLCNEVGLTRENVRWKINVDPALVSKCFDTIFEYSVAPGVSVSTSLENTILWRLEEHSKRRFLVSVSTLDILRFDSLRCQREAQNACVAIPLAIPGHEQPQYCQTR
jgi:hypothetical protein